MQVMGKINPLSSFPSTPNSDQREPELCSELNVKIYFFFNNLNENTISWITNKQVFLKFSL